MKKQNTIFHINDNRRENSFLLRVFTVLLCLLLGTTWGFAQSESKEKEKEIGEKAFDAGEMIIEHVTDKHSWELFKIGNREVVVHLPVIMYYKGELYAFSSKRFDADGRYLQFQLRSDQPYKGKIVAWQKDGKNNAVIDENLPWDFSITKNVFGMFISALLLFIIFMNVSSHYKKRGCSAPKGIAAIVEPIFMFIRKEVAYSNLGKEYGDRFLPYLSSLFFFIFFANLCGLIPIFPFGANITGSTAVALTLAAFTFITTLAFSGKEYWKDIFNPDGVPWWMKYPIPLIPLIEFVEIFTKPIVLMIRLFANIIAGHIVILGFVALIFIFGTFSVGLGLAVSPISILFGLFVDALELLVSFIQAYIFTLLSSIYIAGALGYKPQKIVKNLKTTI